MVRGELVEYETHGEVVNLDEGSAQEELMVTGSVWSPIVEQSSADLIFSCSSLQSWVFWPVLTCACIVLYSEFV